MGRPPLDQILALMFLTQNAIGLSFTSFLDFKPQKIVIFAFVFVLISIFCGTRQKPRIATQSPLQRQPANKTVRPRLLQHKLRKTPSPGYSTLSSLDIRLLEIVFLKRSLFTSRSDWQLCRTRILLFSHGVRPIVPTSTSCTSGEQRESWIDIVCS